MEPRCNVSVVAVVVEGRRYHVRPSPFRLLRRARAGLLLDGGLGKDPFLLRRQWLLGLSLLGLESLFLHLQRGVLLRQIYHF